MKFRHAVASLGVISLLSSAGVALSAGVASAHTPNVSATCSTLTVNLTNYAASQAAKDAVTHQVTVVDTPAKPEVKHTEYVWTKTTHYDNKWSKDSPGDGWVKTGRTQGVGPFVKYEWSHPDDVQTVQQIASPGYGWVKGQAIVIIDSPAVPAVTHQETVVDHPAVPAKTNTVSISIDGSQVVSSDFGTSYSNSIPFSNKYVSHDYNVVVTAWDNSAYNATFNGSSVACAKPDQPAPIVTTTPKSDESCDLGGVENWTETSTVNYVWDDQSLSWVQGEPVVTESDKVLTPYTDDESLAKHCSKPAQPEPVVTVVHLTNHDCDNAYTWDETTTVEFVWDEDSWSWIQGEPVVTESEKKATSLTDDQRKDYDCPVTPPVVPPVTPNPPKTVPPVTTPPVPVSAPSVAPAPAKTVPVAAPNPSLANTGTQFPVEQTVIAAICLLAVGSILVLASRRVRRQD